MNSAVYLILSVRFSDRGKALEARAICIYNYNDHSTVKVCVADMLKDASNLLQILRF